MRNDERELILRCQAGDASAFGPLVASYQRRLYAVAFSVVRNQADAMDIVQESFVKAFRAMDRFDGTASFYTWIYRIVTNAAIDHIRRDAKGATQEFDETIGVDPDAIAAPVTSAATTPSPAEALLQRELRQRIESALSALSPLHRAVIVLREIEGLSYAEMAKVMDCSEGTIMSRLFHARRHLQSLLEGPDYEGSTRAERQTG